MLFWVLMVSPFAAAQAGMIMTAAEPAVGSMPTVIVNRETTVAELSRQALQALFTMRTPRWRDGVPVTVFVLPDKHPTHVHFCQQLLNIFPHQLRRGWDRLVYSGTGAAPYQVPNEKEMLRRVSETPGAVGYIMEYDAPQEVQPVRLASDVALAD